MKHSTYKKLYQAHLGVIDQKGLADLRNEEQDPFYQNLIDLIVENQAPHVLWDAKPFTVDFLTGSPRKNMDETFFAFILRIAAIIKEESYVRTYKKPESHQALVAWIAILRNVLFCSLGLLYNVKWTPETIFTHLEPTLMKLFNEGSASALRRMMINLGVQIAQDEPYPAELFFEKLNFLQTHQFGSFYWRFLHWMAEADAVRGDESALYKSKWRELLNGPLYRTLRCGICMEHFRKMLGEFQLSEGKPLAELFFTMHNRTHAYRRQAFSFMQEPDYTEDQYQTDAKFMRQALLP